MKKVAVGFVMVCLLGCSAAQVQAQPPSYNAALAMFQSRSQLVNVEKISQHDAKLYAEDRIADYLADYSALLAEGGHPQSVLNQIAQEIGRAQDDLLQWQAHYDAGCAHHVQGVLDYTQSNIHKSNEDWPAAIASLLAGVDHLDDALDAFDDADTELDNVDAHLGGSGIDRNGPS